MTRLGVNVDHIATVRQARRAIEPDPVAAAVLALLGGADNITVHLREDARHIQQRDVRILREMLTHGLNLEMAVSEPVVLFAEQIKPDQATLVPERREELTTEGGLDVATHREVVGRTIERLHAAGIFVSLFIDPDPVQVDEAGVLGAEAVEFQTASYSEARKPVDRERELIALERAGVLARERGLHVHMGHGLNYENVPPLLARVPAVEELNIGHSIVARAVLVGMERAVREMKELLRRP
jgi:pyridoxine 5-phosphate synthase